MSESEYSRRELLSGVRKMTTVPLIGTALGTGPFQARAVPKLKGLRKVRRIPTHEFAGLTGLNGFNYREERIDFPASWDVNVMEMAIKAVSWPITLTARLAG